MPIDPAKQRKIIVVHGVQTGDDKELHQDDAVRQLLASRLGDLDVDYAVDLYKYENIADRALNKYKDLSKVLISNTAGSVLAQPIIDLVGDVVISLLQGSTADTIRNGLEAKITEYYNQGHPCYIVAPSGVICTTDDRDDSWDLSEDDGLPDLPDLCVLDCPSPNPHREYFMDVCILVCL